MVSEIRFDDRTVVVTGAGRGIGRHHALQFAARGANVVVADLGVELDGTGSTSAPADSVVAEIAAAGGEALACCADVADEAGAASIVAAAVDAYGGIDVVVNNAGIAQPLDVIENLTVADYRRMIEVHYYGTVHVTKAAWPHLLNAHAGRVVNTTSEGAVGTVPKNSSYGAAKGAVLGFTRALAVDAARNGIAINAIVPRAGTRMAAPEILAHVYDVPIEKVQSLSLDPTLVSPGVLYLAHESCRLNGELLIAGAGQILRLALVASRGIFDEHITPEKIAEHIDEVLDITGAPAIAAGVSDVFG